MCFTLIFTVSLAQDPKPGLHTYNSFFFEKQYQNLPLLTFLTTQLLKFSHTCPSFCNHFSSSPTPQPSDTVACVCACVRVHAGMHCIRACMRACMCVCVHACACMYVHACLCVCGKAQASTCVLNNIYIYAHEAHMDVVFHYKCLGP